MKVHELKVIASNWSKYTKKESWSLRFDDRNYQVGDICIFRKIDRIPEDDWQINIVKQITKITAGIIGLKNKYVVLDLKLIAEVSELSLDNKH